MIFPFGIHARAPPAFPVFRASYHLDFLSFLRSPPTYFLPCDPRLKAAFSREIAHMQAALRGDQMVTKFWKLVRDEQGIGEYCGDNDAQLGRMNVF
jgi:hypothetical protein